MTEDRSQPLVRFVLLRSVALLQLVFFVIWTRQYDILVGRDGLTPMRDYLGALTAKLAPDAPLRAPTLFWFDDSDGAMLAAGLVGITLSLATVLGVSNAGVQLALWALVVSVVNAGQDWYGYGWEMMMAEASLLAVLLAPWRTWRARDALRPGAHWPDAVPVWLFRWLTFRVLFGAFAIKLRGDPCWTDLTCLDHHFETQPNPHALSWVFHWLPGWVHAAGVVFNHLAEGLLPWLVLGPRLGRRVAAAGLAAFQLALIASGNLAYFNWLTLAVGLSALDDAWIARLAPRFAAWVAGPVSGAAGFDASSSGAAASGAAADDGLPAAASVSASQVARRSLHAVTLAVVAWRSLPVVENLFFAERQAMNASYDPLHLVNTYGAFGSVGRERYDAVIEGTADAPDDPAARWEPYALPCAPADDITTPCWVTPYHLHLDWQMWFVPLQGVEAHPWLVHLVAKLLDADPLARAQFVDPPFAEAPPRAIRVVRVRTRFTTPDEPGWRRREPAGVLVRPLTREDPGLRRALEAHGWDG